MATRSLKANGRRPRKEHRTALKLFAQLQAEGFTGSYSRVTEATDLVLKTLASGIRFAILNRLWPAS